MSTKMISSCSSKVISASSSRTWRQNDGGANAIRVGDVAKSHSDDFTTSEIKSLDSRDRPLEGAGDTTGGLWVFVGADSGFEGKTTLYYVSIRLTLEEK